MNIERKYISSRVDVGATVLIQSLQSAKELNGRRGIVTELLDNGRAAVKLFPARQKKVVSVKVTNLETYGRTLMANENLGEAVICNNCRKQMHSTESKICSKCKLATYCSRECQLQDWQKNHKSDCKVLRVFRKTEHEQQIAKINNTATTEEMEKIGRSAGDIAVRLSSQGRNQRAEEILKAAIQKLETVSLPETTAYLYRELGCCAREENRIDEAVELHEKSKELNPLSCNTCTNLVRLYEVQGDQESAVEQMEMNFALFVPHLDPVDCLFEIGQLYMSMKNLEKAKNAFERLIKLNPTAPNLASTSPMRLTASREQDRNDTLAIAYGNLGLIYKWKLDKNIEELVASDSGEGYDASMMYRNCLEAYEYFQMAKKFNHTDPYIEEQLESLISHRRALEKAIAGT